MLKTIKAKLGTVLYRSMVMLLVPIVCGAGYFYSPQIYDLANSVYTGILPVLRGGTGTTTSTGTGSVVLSAGPTLTGAPAIAAATGTSLTLSGSFTGLHLLGNSATPTIVAGAGAGSSPTVSVVGNDTDMQVVVVAGTGATASGAIIATITYSTAYPGTPNPVFAPANGTTALLTGLYINGTSSTTFTLTNNGAVPLTSTVGYRFNVHVGN